jgi:hypothetical protein
LWREIFGASTKAKLIAWWVITPCYLMVGSRCDILLANQARLKVAVNAVTDWAPGCSPQSGDAMQGLLKGEMPPLNDVAAKSRRFQRFAANPFTAGGQDERPFI